MDEETEATEGESSGPPPIELVKSYAAFGVQAVRKRLVLAASLFVGITGITLGLLAVWPRTYYCEMRLMVQNSPLFAAPPEPLRGASNLIRRHENLRTIVQRVELVKNWESQRAGILRLKDRIRERLRGKVPDEIMRDMLVNTLAGAIFVDEQERSLTIGVAWQNPQMAARLVEAARETFMESRHATEIAGIQEKMAIWDGHATNVRAEVNRLAEEIQQRKEDQLVRAQKATAEASDVGGRVVPVRLGAPRKATVAASDTPAVPDAGLAELKADLQKKKERLADLEGEQARRVREAKAKIANLKLDLTAEHPLVLQAERLLTALETPSAELVAARADVKSLSDDVAHREELAKSASISAMVASSNPSAAAAPAALPALAAKASAPSTPELLPSKILELVESGAGIDPTMGTQLTSAVEKYTRLRNDISAARVELDTAQAAFNHRYKVVVPTKVPGAPIKPVVPKVLGIGILAALLLALLIPVLLELKRGLIVERWQVYQLRLPVLPEVGLPPEALESRDRG